MAADFVVRYGSFLGGDWGVRDSARARDNQYRAENMRLYDSELLGVRPGLRSLNITGLPNHPTLAGPRGFDLWHNELVIILDQLYLAEIKNDAATASAVYTPGAFPGGAPTEPVRMAQFYNDLYLNFDGGIQKLGAISRTLSTITVPVNLAGLTRWNYYLVAWDKDAPWRLYYTTVDQSGADPDDWNANNYLDIGGDDPIVALVPMYNGLYVGKKTGWHRVSGVLGDRPWVREIAQGNGPLDDRRVVTTTDNRILGWGHDNVPVWFNGDVPYLADEFRVKALKTEYPLDSVVAAPQGRHVLMLGEPAADFDSDSARTAMIHYDNARWSTHGFRERLGGIAGHDLRMAVDKPSDVMFFINRPNVVNDPVEVFSYDIHADRVKNDNDPWACGDEAGDGVLIDGYLELPAFYDAQSRRVKVRSVVVQFRHWQSGIAGTQNELRCNVIPLGRYEGGSLETRDKMWTAPSNTAHADGTDDSWRIPFGNQGWGNGFQVRFPVVRGVAIRSVEVHVEVRQGAL